MMYPKSRCSVSPLGSAVSIKKQFDLLACELCAEAAPIDLKAVIIAGQQVGFVCHACVPQGLVKDIGLIDRDDAVTRAEQRDRRRGFCADISDGGQGPIAVGVLSE